MVRTPRPRPRPTAVQVVPPSVDRNSVPLPVPTSTVAGSVGLTASAKTGLSSRSGRTPSWTQPLSGRAGIAASAEATLNESAQAQKRDTVRRRWKGRKGCRPTFYAAFTPRGRGAGQEDGDYSPLRASRSRKRRGHGARALECVSEYRRS